MSPTQRRFPPGLVPETVPLPRANRGDRETPIVYSPVFQRPLMAQYREFPYGINTDTYPMVIPANGTVISQFTIEGDNDYFLETIRAVIQTTTGILFTVQIVDQRSGAALFSTPTHISAIAFPGGTYTAAGSPGSWSQLDWLVAPAGAKATLTVTLADLSGAVNTCWLSIFGRRQLVNPGQGRTQLTQ